MGRLAAGFASAAVIAVIAVIAVNIYGRGYRQRHMPVMEAVWPITALYFGPLAVWGYHRFGRPASTPWLREHGGHHPPDEPRWAGIAVGASHCAAGCTLGDVISAAAKADILSLTVLPESAPDADQPGVLVPHAARHDRRLLHLLAGQRVADPPRHQGGTSRA